MLCTRLIAGHAAILLISAVFASFSIAINRFETFIEPLEVRPGQPAPVTLRVPWTRVHLEDGRSLGPGQLIVARGEVVDRAPQASVIQAFETGRRPPGGSELLGLWFVYLLLAWMLFSYLRAQSPGRGGLVRSQLGLAGVAIGLLVAAKALLLLTALPAYCLPVAVLPIWAGWSLDRRCAPFVALAFAVFAASLDGFRLGLVAVYAASGWASVAWLRGRSKGSQVLVATAVGALAGGAVYVAAQSMLAGGFDPAAELEARLYAPMLSVLLGAWLAGPLALLLQAPAAMALGAVSRPRLLELSDLDQPLLKKIAKEAPGSWEHSRAMANLAEAAANAIGADALLTRVGAYYHDLGKTCQPAFFVENLKPGQPSPHGSLAPDVSADAIMAHVVEGVNILRRGGIPEPVIEFAYTHHGTGVIEYFWHKCLEEGNPRKRDESFFRYPGMRPRTKETGILMLIDSIEAASRTIDPPEKDKFEEMVQRIIFVKLRQGQLDASGMTMGELRTISSQIVDSLCSIYHSRIRYPWQDKKERGASPLPLPGAATEEDVARARALAEPDTEDAPNPTTPTTTTPEPRSEST